MGLGFGFRCCCERWDDSFDREEIGEEWAVSSGEWSIDSDWLITSSPNAKIVWTHHLFRPRYSVLVRVAVEDAADRPRIYLGDSVSIELVPASGVIPNPAQGRALVYDGETLLGEVRITLAVGWYAELYVSVDGRQVSLHSTNWRFPTCDVEAFLASETLGQTVALGTGPVSGKVRFDSITLDRATADCMPKRICEGWEDGVRPAHTYAEIGFLVDGGLAGYSYSCDCSEANGIFELEPGCWHNRIDSCLVGRFVDACGQAKIAFVYEKVQDGQYLARLTYEYFADAFLNFLAWKATFEKTYTAPATPGYEDDLPLVSFEAMVTRDTVACWFDESPYWGQQVHVWTE